MDYITNNVVLNSDPGTKYVYSNLGAGLLGQLLADQSGLSYEELVATVISKPYNLQSTTTNRSNVEDKIIKGLNVLGTETSYWDLASLAGAGGILSSVEDLSLFAKAQFNNEDKALALTREPTFTISETMDIGLGWHILKRDDDVIYWHNGGTGGFSSSMAINTKKRTAAIILCNAAGSTLEEGNLDKLNLELLKTLE